MHRKYEICPFHQLICQLFRKKVNKMAQITKETIIMDVLRLNPETAQFFFEIGMHCLGCPSASGESVAEACAVHGEDADALVERINAFLAEN